MNWDRVSRHFPSFGIILVISSVLRIGLILYSEWHDAHSIVKYTDVDYRVFGDATRFLLNPTETNRAQGPLAKWLRRWVNIGDPYTRQTYRYTPLLALLLAPNEWIHASFGKYLFAACDIVAGILIYQLLLSDVLPRAGLFTSTAPAPKAPARSSHSPPRTSGPADALARRAAQLAALHLLSPFVFSISTRGSSESVLLLLVLLTLHAALRGRWAAAAVLLGLSTHWKIYPVVYGAACVGVLGAEGAEGRGALRRVVTRRTMRFALLAAGTFFVLGAAMYSIWGRPFLEETYLYHLHRRDHRHNFSPYFYLIYLAYPGLPAAAAEGAWWQQVVRSPLASFVPQMSLALGAGLLFARTRADLPFAWFVQTAAFVVFNKVCTSQYFLWYLVFLPLLIPRLEISTRRVVLYAAVWMGTQALWLSQAFRLEWLGEPVFTQVWLCGLLYVVGHAWVLGGIMDGYVF